MLSFDDSKLNTDGSLLTVPNKKNAGWVIDGQHRLAGVHESGADIQLPVVAFLNLPLNKQIEQFVKINKEAKNVPTSLYLDLLKHLPDKSEAEQTKERAVDLAMQLQKEPDSPFYGKISILTSPKPGQLSLNNFVRKVSPLVAQNKGRLHVYSVTEQIGILRNLYDALSHAFPDVYEPAEGTSVFFKTIGFGGVIGALPTLLDLTIKTHKGFKVEQIAEMFKKIDDFPFKDWDSLGTGTEAENLAATHLRDQLKDRWEATGGADGMIDL